MCATDYECTERARVCIFICIVRNCQLWIIWKCCHVSFFVASLLLYLRSKFCTSVSVCVPIFFSFHHPNPSQPAKPYFGLPTQFREAKKRYSILHQHAFIGVTLYISMPPPTHPFRFHPKVRKKNRLNEKIEKKHRSILSKGRAYTHTHTYILTRIPFDWHFKWLFFVIAIRMFRLYCLHLILFLYFCFCLLYNFFWYAFFDSVQILNLSDWIKYWINWMALISNISLFFIQFFFGAMWRKQLMENICLYQITKA